MKRLGGFEISYSYEAVVSLAVPELSVGTAGR